MGSAEYLEALGGLAGRSRWILDGAPYYLDDLIYRAADTVLVLDYPKHLVMWRVLKRTLAVELLRRPSGAHHPNPAALWRDETHPLRWAWTSHQARHQEAQALTTRTDLPTTEVVHFTHPHQAARWLSEQ
ncbi:hypothetical protein [Kribbella amoyensis]|nr:hypothetical protein [Kribbella amoyensis]